LSERGPNIGHDRIGLIRIGFVHEQTVAQTTVETRLLKGKKQRARGHNENSIFISAKKKTSRTKTPKYEKSPIRNKKNKQAYQSLGQNESDTLRGQEEG
jgi:hypothetical protein